MKKLIISLIAGVGLTGLMACQNSGETNKQECLDSTGAVIENIMTRLSVRKFTDKAIPADTMEQLLKCGMAAPSAVNKQPWAFVVVTDRAVLDSLAAGHPNFRLETAAAAIVVCGDKERFLEGPAAEFWVQDCSAVTENILLAAHAYGLGAVWCGVYHGPESDRVPKVSAALNLPDNIIPLNVIAMGYPDEQNQPKDKWKPENIHYQKW